MKRFVLLTVASAFFAFAVPSFAGSSDLIHALDALKDHINGTAPLTGTQIASHKATIDANKTLFDDSSAIITACFDLVETYDTIVKPMFVSGSPVQSFTRSSTSDTDISWAVYNVMQYIIDYSYTSGTIGNHPNLIDGFKFGSSAFFPGEVNPPADPNAVYTVTVDGSYLNTWGHDVMHEERSARKPTGAYLAPGSIATVTVPSKIVGKGYQVRIGAHSWDFSNKPTIKRPDRSTILYDINSTEIKVASPLGGGIYIEVPRYSNQGLVEVTIKNAVRSPYFSKKSFHNTTLSEWQNTERHHPAPWADFQTEKFMMQVPTDWIYNFNDPVTLMDKWDLAMDVLEQLMGFPESYGKETLYIQPDLFFRTGAHGPGYPSVNYTYNPNKSYGGNVNNYFVKGPDDEGINSAVFHEMGHGFLFVKFSGETESTVNLHHVAVWNRKFGFDLDKAFRKSRGSNNTFQTVDTTAVTWMLCNNFVERDPMASGEKAYQLKGHAKFVDIARLFGWEGLDQFWYSINVDYENGYTWSRHGSNYNDLIFRWCESVGVDLRPLFHFWGIYPSNASSLKTRIDSASLLPSGEIYDLLVKYRSLIPENNQQFHEFALAWWKRQPSPDGNMTEREHAAQWDVYNENSASALEDVIDDILALYYPDGPPHYSVNLGGDMVSWSGQTINLSADIVNNSGTTLTYNWSVEPVAGVTLIPEENQAAVTIAKPEGDPAVYTVKLTVSNGGINSDVTDKMRIEVYDDSCQAARLGLGQIVIVDINQDCIVDLKDFAIVAISWLNDNALKVPISK